jgi:hypothetical protein
MRRSSRHLNFATVLLVAISVSACAMFETGETKLQAVKTVGIISAVGGEMSFARAIVQQATTALNGRFQVQPIRYNRAAFAAVKDSPVAPVNLVRDDPFKKLVRTEVSPQGLDAYIVITKAKSNFGRGALKVEGIGFVNYGTMLASYNQIHALYEIRVFDGKTFDVIEKRSAPPLDDAVEVKLPGPTKQVDDSYSPGTGEPVRNENLHRAITELIVRSLSTTLSDMHLADVR